MKKIIYDKKDLITLLLIAGFIVGLIFFSFKNKVDYQKETAEMISCPFEIEFLTNSKIGFRDKQECVDLNLTLHKQYLDECLNKIKLTQNEKNDQFMVDQCVYHKVSIDFLTLSQEYFIFKKNN